MANSPKNFFLFLGVIGIIAAVSLTLLIINDVQRSEIPGESVPGYLLDQSIKNLPSFRRDLSAPTCEIWHENIEQAFVNDNYCRIDSDCQAVPLGGRLVEFGCVHYLNKAIATSTVYAALNDYAQSCSDAIDKCVFSYKTICRAGQCVAASRDEALSRAGSDNFEKSGNLAKEKLPSGETAWTLIYYDYPGGPKTKVYLVFTGKSLCPNQGLNSVCVPDKLGNDFVNVVGRLYDNNRVSVSGLSVFVE